MKLSTTLPVFIFLGFSLPSFAAGNSRCLAEYKVEEARIIHKAEVLAKANPPGRDAKSQQQLMMPIHQALKAAAERAEKCESDSRKSTGNSRLENQCGAIAIEQIDELKKRYAGRSDLSFGEQTARREAQNRIIDSRMKCERDARRK